MLPTAEELQKMKEMDAREADREQLVDISEVQIDKSQPVERRIKSYLEQVRNPYLVKVGDYVLKFQYAEDGKELEDCMMDYVSKMANYLK